MNILDNPILSRSFYDRETVQVARDLLGAIIIRHYDSHILAGIIAETEAYCGPIDPASHAYTRETPRNTAMFGPAGHSYVYFTYGNHYCLNLVAKAKDQTAGGVLIRALIPIEGIEYMKIYRQVADVRRLTSGPGNIGKALQLTRADNHIDVTKHGELYVVQGTTLPDSEIEITKRIGISKAQDKLWRFVIKKDITARLYAENNL